MEAKQEDRAPNAVRAAANAVRDAAREACAAHFSPVADGLSPEYRAKEMGRRRSWRHRWLGREAHSPDGEQRASETTRRGPEKVEEAVDRDEGADAGGNEADHDACAPSPSPEEEEEEVKADDA